MQSKKGTYVEIQNDIKNMFNFYDSLHSFMNKWHILMSATVAPTLKKTVKPKNNLQSFQARFLTLL